MTRTALRRVPALYHMMSTGVLVLWWFGRSGDGGGTYYAGQIITADSGPALWGLMLQVIRMAHQCRCPIANGCVVGSKSTIGLIRGETLWVGPAVAVIVVGGPTFGSIRE